MQSLLKPAGAFLSRHGCTKFLIWFIALFLLTALTIKDLVPLVDEYRNNNVAIQVGLVIDNTDFRPPQLVLTIPFYTPKDEALMTIARHLVNGTGNCTPCEKLEQVGWDVWNSGTDLSQFPEDDIESFYLSLSLKFVQKLYHSLEKNLNPLSSEYSSWNSPIFTAAMNFFIWIQENDFYQVPNGPQAASPVLSDMLQNLTTHPLLDSLYARMFQAFCHRLTFSKIVAENEYQMDGVRSMTCEDLLLNASTPLAIDSFWGLAIALPGQDTPQMAVYEFVQLNHEDGFWKPDTQEKSFYVYLDPSILYTVAHEPIFSSYIYEAVREGTKLTITATYGIQARTRDSRPGSTCHKETDTMTCFTKCTKLYQINKCSCIPFSLKRGLTFDPELPHCTMAMYTKCNLSGTVPTEARNYCIAKCKNICEYTSFHFQFNHVSETSHHAGNESRVIFRISPAATSFTEFVLTVKNTPEQFLSQMGGLLNFYLGFDGLTMFATVLILIDFMKRYLSKKEAETLESNAGTQMSTVNSVRSQTSVSNHEEGYQAELRSVKAEMEKQKRDLAILKTVIRRQQVQNCTCSHVSEFDGYPGYVTGSD